MTVKTATLTPADKKILKTIAKYLPGSTVILVCESGSDDQLKEIGRPFPIAKNVEPGLAANFLTRELMAVVNRSDIDLDTLDLDADEISSLLQMRSGNKITEKVAKDALIAYLTKGKKPVEFIERQGLAKDLSAEDVEKAVEKVLSENKAAVADLKRGKQKSLNFLAGQVMKLTRAKADAKAVQDIIFKKIKGG